MFHKSFRSQTKGALLLWALSAGLFLNARQASGENAQDSRSEIQKAYSKASEAARIKFINGMLSVRSLTYAGFSMDGKKVEPHQERADLVRLFDRALSIKETTEILSFREKDPLHVVCQTHDLLELVYPMSPPKPSYVTVINSYSTDEWVKEGQTWRQASNRVNKQSVDSKTYTPEPASKVVK